MSAGSIAEGGLRNQHFSLEAGSRPLDASKTPPVVLRTGWEDGTSAERIRGNELINAANAHTYRHTDSHTKRYTTQTQYWSACVWGPDKIPIGP